MDTTTTPITAYNCVHCGTEFHIVYDLDNVEFCPCCGGYLEDEDNDAETYEEYVNEEN